MLGSTPNPTTTPADRVMQDVAAHFGVEHTYQPAPVGVFFGEPGEPAPDPFFGGIGPERAGCVTCGGCMVGCRFNAKNTLDRNYLYLAEQAGAVVYPETEVVDVTPPSGGWLYGSHTTPWAWRNKKSRSFSAGSGHLLGRCSRHHPPVAETPLGNAAAHFRTESAIPSEPTRRPFSAPPRPISMSITRRVSRSRRQFILSHRPISSRSGTHREATRWVCWLRSW